MRVGGCLHAGVDACECCEPAERRHLRILTGQAAAAPGPGVVWQMGGMRGWRVVSGGWGGYNEVSPPLSSYPLLAVCLDGPAVSQHTLRLEY